MKKYIANLFIDASKKLDYLNDREIQLSIPANPLHGDLSTNIAMILTKELKRNPRQIAEEIISNLDYDKNNISKIEIAGPGFINFTFTNSFLADILKEINQQKEKFGESQKYSHKKANVEFISANPTGPLTIGHGRNAVIGDTIANLLEAVGYQVDREYYFNNAGRQMRVLGESLNLRYLELLGEKIDFPEDYYQGEYIKDIAQKLIDEFGNDCKDKEINFFKEKAEKEIFVDIKNTLSRLGIEMAIFYNENDLYESGKLEEVKQKLASKKLTYEKDGALWLKLSELGREDDKVIVKSTGEPTYRLPDIAYHTTKFDRNYDLMVDLFGSDHNATYPDVIAGVKALGYDETKIKVVIHQFVTITQGGEAVKMSTRKANFITIDELIDEVGADVVRYFFLMRNVNSHLNFDLEIAKKQSDENPVFYLQYAHARICSILRMTEEQGLEPNYNVLNKLEKDEELNLVKKMHHFEDEILYAAENCEPNKIANYLEELASLFHKFYTECRIIGSEKDLAEARIALVTSVRTVLQNGLKIIGISAPEKM
ncbi:arginyl-trna synthetase [hydrocarbon metagenome]|uniref:arginine--tRNA ligase n=1 Tax=hydrocarbon metagenome TaxID=938273 RepID=A0A0W8G176_9ZZZZ